MDPPLTNATLTKIETGGGGFVSDDADAALTVRWSGLANAYVTEKLETEFGQAYSETKVTRIVVSRDVGKLVQRGDTVTFDFNDQTGIVRRAGVIQSYPLFGTTRIWFKEE